MNQPLNASQLRQIQEGDAHIKTPFEFGFLFAQIEVTDESAPHSPDAAILLDKFKADCPEPFQFYKPYSKLFNPKSKKGE